MSKANRIEPMTAWAICDNDGGRLHRPHPITGYIYPTETQAKQERQFQNMAAEYYPIREIRITAA